jgi:uncharacterized integral membrane protein
MATNEPRRRDRLPTGRLVSIGIVVVLLAVFIAQNFTTVDVRLFVVERQIRLAFALLLAAALGFAAGWIARRLRD